MKNPKILVCPGSIRDGSYNSRLARAASQLLVQMDCSVTHISLRDYELPIYNSDLESQEGIPPKVFELAKVFEDHHGVLMVSPEYNASVSPLLKNVIDWMSRVSSNDKDSLSPYASTVFALASCSPGSLGGLRGLDHLRSILVSVSAGLIISEQVGVGNASKAFDDDNNLINKRSLRLLKELCASLVKKSAINGNGLY